MKTLLVLIDGLCAEALQHTDTPNIDKIIQKGASSLQCQTVFPPITLPAHVSLFTSLDPEQHGIIDNSPSPQSLALTFFDLATRENLKTAFFYTWENLRILSRTGSLDHSCFMKKCKTTIGDHLIMEKAIEYIHAETPDFAFIYLGCTDEAGHKEGFMSLPYFQQIERADHAIGQLLHFLEESCLDDEYTCLLTSDHGGHGHKHDGSVPEDFIIPWMIMGPSIRKNHIIESPVSILDTVPTLARIMRLPALDFWQGEVNEEIFFHPISRPISHPKWINFGEPKQIAMEQSFSI